MEREFNILLAKVFVLQRKNPMFHVTISEDIDDLMERVYGDKGKEMLEQMLSETFDDIGTVPPTTPPENAEVHDAIEPDLPPDFEPEFNVMELETETESQDPVPAPPPPSKPISPYDAKIAEPKPKPKKFNGELDISVLTREYSSDIERSIAVREHLKSVAEKEKI